MDKHPLRPITQVPEIPDTIIEEKALEPRPKKPKPRPRKENPALTAMKRVGTKLDPAAEAEAAASTARREISRQETIAVWKKMT